MSNEKVFFEEHISSLRNLTAFYQYIHDNATLIEANALLRAEYVLIVSAFDNYLHQIVRRKIRELFFNGQNVSSDLNLPISVFQMIHNESNVVEQQAIFDIELRKIMEKDSYQAPKSVEFALSLININHIWTTVAPCMGDRPDNIRSQLALIVKRRNQIAHEADLDYSTGSPREIYEQTVLECRDFLKKFVTSIDALIT